LRFGAEQRFSFRGRGIDGGIGGELTLAGSVAEASVIGGIRPASRQAAIADAAHRHHPRQLTFSGGLSPELDSTRRRRPRTSRRRSRLLVRRHNQASLSPRLRNCRRTKSCLGFSSPGVWAPVAIPGLAARGRRGRAFGGGGERRVRENAQGSRRGFADLDAGGANGPTVGASAQYYPDPEISAFGVRAGAKTARTPRRECRRDVGKKGPGAGRDQDGRLHLARTSERSGNIERRPLFPLS